jgi:hypothetical protein
MPGMQHVVAQHCEPPMQLMPVHGAGVHMPAWQ